MHLFLTIWQLSGSKNVTTSASSIDNYAIVQGKVDDAYGSHSCDNVSTMLQCGVGNITSDAAWSFATAVQHDAHGILNLMYRSKSLSWG